MQYSAKCYNLHTINVSNTLKALSCGSDKSVQVATAIEPQGISTAELMSLRK